MTSISHRTEQLEDRIRKAGVVVPQKLAQISNDPTTSPDFRLHPDLEALIGKKEEAQEPGDLRYYFEDITRVQLRLLRALSGIMTSREVSEISGTPRQNCASAMKLIQHKGLVNSGRDGKSATWVLTKKGRALLDRASEAGF